MTLTPLTGADTAADRIALQALVRFQQLTPLAGLRACDEAAWTARLAAFKAHSLAVSGQPAPEGKWSGLIECALQQLVAGALVQPQVALQPGLGIAGATAGPVTHDIAALLRVTPLDEAQELDLAIRWWQLARGAGLPVPDDFGECWRALEWVGLLRQLALLPELQDADRAQALTTAVKVALRYGPLKPLLVLLQPLSGVVPQAGYTF